MSPSRSMTLRISSNLAEIFALREVDLPEAVDVQELRTTVFQQDNGPLKAGDVGVRQKSRRFGSWLVRAIF